MTITRTDRHRPSRINCDDYTFVGVEYDRTDDIGSVYFLLEERKIITAHITRTGGSYADHPHGGTCMICGASALYTAIFYCAESNEYIRTGFDCADKLEIGNNAKFRGCRAAVADARERKAGRAKAQVILDDLNLTAAWAVYESTDNRGEYEESTISDIVGKLVKWGDLSPKQGEFIRKLLAQIASRAELQAARKIEHEEAAPCPNGRMEVEGCIIKTEWRDNAYGGRLTMTVKTGGGYLLWGTVPSTLTTKNVTHTDGGRTWTEQRGLERGDRVRFTATLEQSDRDAKFGFYKRPSKASFVD